MASRRGEWGTRYAPHDVVMAKLGGGWWPGVVTKAEERSVLVSFPAEDIE